MMKKTNYIFMTFLLTFGVCGNANSQTAPSCEAMGYTMTEAECSAKDKATLKCAFDESKVYCGLNACDRVTEVKCTAANQSCGKYFDSCPSKCESCKCTPPSDYLTIAEANTRCPYKNSAGIGYTTNTVCGTKMAKCCSAPPTGWSTYVAYPAGIPGQLDPVCNICRNGFLALNWCGERRYKCCSGAQNPNGTMCLQCR